MHLEFLLEERSAEAALDNLLPKLIAEASWRLIVYNGKSDLLDALEGALKGYAAWMTEEYRLVILLDRDDDDCKRLKQKLEETVQRTGLITKSQQVSFQVLTRIAIEELEAWFFGDPNAIRTAYPKVKTFENKEKYRDPDNIKGGTWEALEKLLQSVGYYPGGLPKIEVAKKISAHMNPQDNRSKSFSVFAEGLNACLE
jgi:hypothetical protein